MTTRLALLATLFTLFGALVLVADEPGARPEAALLGELKKLAQPPEADKTKDLTHEEALDLLKKRGETALSLLKDFEAKYPKSADLSAARTAALAAVGHSDDEELHTRGVPLARRLKKEAPKGSDDAARADLYLLGREYHKVMNAARSPEELRKAYDRNAGRMRKVVAVYLAEYPKYRPAADAFRVLVRLAESMDDDETRDAIVAAVAKNFPDHPMARVLRRKEATGKEIDFDFTPFGSDKTTSLKELRGKVVVVDFWASWCLACKAEEAHLKELYAKYHAQGLEVVGVSLDEKDAAAKKYLAAHKSAWAQVVGAAARKLGEEWGIEHLPHQFVIDRKGRLRNADADGKLDDLVPELLAEKE